MTRPLKGFSISLAVDRVLKGKVSAVTESSVVDSGCNAWSRRLRSSGGDFRIGFLWRVLRQNTVQELMRIKHCVDFWLALKFECFHVRFSDVN